MKKRLIILLLLIPLILAWVTNPTFWTKSGIYIASLFPNIVIGNDSNSGILSIATGGGYGLGARDFSIYKSGLKWIISPTAYFSLDINPDSTNTIFQRQGGNVGIGTTNPSQKLEINGSLKIGNYVLPSADGSNVQVLSTNGAGTLGWQYPVTVDTDVETTGVSFDETPEVTILSLTDTVSSGHIVYLSASGYILNNAAGTTTIKLKYDSTIVQTVLVSQIITGTTSWACNAVVTGLSGSTVFSVTAQSSAISGNNTAYGNLVELEF
jgi:hypothetical protein